MFRLKGLLRDILSPPGMPDMSGGISLPDPAVLKERTDALIRTILEEVGDESLIAGYEMIV